MNVIGKMILNITTRGCLRRTWVKHTPFWKRRNGVDIRDITTRPRAPVNGLWADSLYKLKSIQYRRTKKTNNGILIGIMCFPLFCFSLHVYVLPSYLIFGLPFSSNKEVSHGLKIWKRQWIYTQNL